HDCQTEHSNGLGQHFYDCLALGTYNQSQAEAAAMAATIAGAGAPVLSHCNGTSTNTIICRSSSTQCACWRFSHLPSVCNVQGHVSFNMSTSTCMPPLSGTWQ